MKLLATVLIIVGLPFAHAAGQEVRGRVRDGASAEPVLGAFVMLRDSVGLMRAGALTDSAGWYRLTAPRPGRYRVEAERIGFSGAVSDLFDLPDGAVVAHDLTVEIRPISLPELTVGGTNRCESARNRAARTAALWDEARKALTVASWAAAQQLIAYEMTRFSLELDRRGRPIREYREDRIHQVAGTPWAAQSSERLMADGFIQRSNNGMYDLFVPDGEVLLSSEFIETHCLEVREDRRDRSRIGLAFRPSERPRKVDVEGTLWLDGSTLALTSIEFLYVQAVARNGTASAGGGSVSFAHLPSGLWVMSGWKLQMPVTPRASRGTSNRVQIEEGSQVVRAITPAGTPLWNAPPSALPRVSQKSAVQVREPQPGVPEFPVLSAAGLAAWSCGPRKDADKTTEVLGLVLKSDGEPLRGQAVTLEWKVKDIPQGVQALVDEAGVYVFCRVPVNTDVVLSIKRGDLPEERVLIRTQPGTLTTRTFTYER